MKREKRPSRLSWFAFNVDDFLDDPRTRRLTTREQSFWAMICIKSFRLQGQIYASDETISSETGATIKEAAALIDKLISSGLLKQTHGPECFSKRMEKEHKKAAEAYARFSKMGQESAEKHGVTNLRVIK